MKSIRLSSVFLIRLVVVVICLGFYPLGHAQVPTDGGGSPIELTFDPLVLLTTFFSPAAEKVSFEGDPQIKRFGAQGEWVDLSAIAFNLLMDPKPKETLEQIKAKVKIKDVRFSKRSESVIHVDQEGIELEIGFPSRFILYSDAKVNPYTYFNQTLAITLLTVENLDKLSLTAESPNVTLHLQTLFRNPASYADLTQNFAVFIQTARQNYKVEELYFTYESKLLPLSETQKKTCLHIDMENNLGILQQLSRGEVPSLSSYNH